MAASASGSGSLRRYLIQRLLLVIPMVLILLTVVFILMRVAPGDPVRAALGGRVPNSVIAEKRHELGFDKPLYVQYFRTMDKIFTGTVVSYTQQVNVIDEIKRGLPATLSLAIGAGIIWFTLGVVFGLLSALSAGKFLDRFLTVAALIGVSTPVFFLGAMMLYYLGYKFKLFPLGGYVPLTQNPWEWFTHLLMPWFALSVLFIGVYSRVLRGTILDTINEDYVRAARTKSSPIVSSTVERSTRE